MCRWNDKRADSPSSGSASQHHQLITTLVVTYTELLWYRTASRRWHSYSFRRAPKTVEAIPQPGGTRDLHHYNRRIRGWASCTAIHVGLLDRMRTNGYECTNGTLPVEEGTDQVNEWFRCSDKEEQITIDQVFRRSQRTQDYFGAPS